MKIYESPMNIYGSIMKSLGSPYENLVFSNEMFSASDENLGISNE